MALHIPKERIESGDLTEYEYDYLKTRGRLPGQKDGRTVVPLEDQPTPSIGDIGGIEEDEEDEDYEDGWNNDQRRAELTRRKLSIDGKKDDLISRLRRSDTDQLEDDDYSKLED